MPLAVRASSTAEEWLSLPDLQAVQRDYEWSDIFIESHKPPPVPAPERLRDMEFDLTGGDSSSDHIAEDEGHNPLDEEGSDSETEAWW